MEATIWWGNIEIAAVLTHQGSVVTDGEQRCTSCLLVWTCKSLSGRKRERDREAQVENNVARLLLINCDPATQFDSWEAGERVLPSLSIFPLKLARTG